MPKINWTPLKEEALKALEKAYAPYSQFSVGAAILTNDGHIYSGCNIENASYGGTVCAERVAIWKAVSEGQPKISAILITTREDRFIPPCGFCRQIISEFVEDCPIGILNNQNEIRETTLGKLLPDRFDKKYL